MPSSRTDLTEVEGRVKYARQQVGYKQDEFAKEMNYTPQGWQKIEQGQRKISVEKLIKANEILELDMRYYFGQIPYHDAIKGVASNYADLVNTIEDLKRKVSAPEEIDPIAYWVHNRPALRRIVALLSEVRDTAIEKVEAYAEGYLARMDEEKKREKSAESA